MATVYPGQVFPGYIKPQHGVHGPIRFSYKGLWPEARAQYFRQLQAASTDEEGEAVAISTMKMCLVQWNLKYPENHPNKKKAGKPVPITEDALQNDVMVHLRNHIMNVLTWAIPSDVDPEEPLESKIEKINQKASGKSIAELIAEADAALVGNSSEVADSSSVTPE